MSKYQESGKSRAREEGWCLRPVAAVRRSPHRHHAARVVAHVVAVPETTRPSSNNNNKTRKHNRETEGASFLFDAQADAMARCAGAAYEHSFLLINFNNFNRFRQLLVRQRDGLWKQLSAARADAQTRAHSETTARCALLACTRGRAKGPSEGRGRGGQSVRAHFLILAASSPIAE